MKKILIFFTLASGLCFQAFTFEGERGSAFGIDFGNFFEIYSRDGEVNSYLGSPGINLSSYDFSGEGDVGFFVNAALIGLPVFHSTTNNFQGSRLRLQTGLIAGVATRRTLSDRLSMLQGIGINIMLHGFDRADVLPEYGNVFHFTINYDFGIGADIEFKYRIGERLFLRWGGVLTIDFLRIREAGIETPGGKELESNTGLVRGFVMFGARPYLSLGSILF
ncbi:MAG: hypothetical protein FWE09_01675 [Treponema sp.]|nr:hypothetical protein [Treponema sp.]